MSTKTPDSSDDNVQRVELGRLGAPHGVRGWMKLISYTQPVENVLEYQPWSLYHQGCWQPTEVLAARQQGKGWVVQLAGIETREQAQQLTHAVIGVPRAQLPPAGPDECYWLDLIGLQVKTEAGQLLGSVEQMRDIGAHGVMVVKDAENQREHLIPFVRGHFILRVDLPAQLITVDWDADF